MINAIPNPKKAITVEVPICDAYNAVLNIPLFSKSYTLNKANDIANIVTFEAFEFLSLGVYIDISSKAISENQTEIEIEIRRKAGTFNQSHEVTKANQHISTLIDILSESLKADPETIEKLKQEQPKPAPSLSIEEKKRLAIEMKKNNPVKYYIQQGLMLLAAVGLLYLLYKLIAWAF
ncbi:MAG TPA: hypothetical protein VIM64_11585 [Puia sp.]